MRKFFVFVLTFFMTVCNVWALDNTTRLYKYYRYNKVYGDYVSKDEVNEEYPFTDENDYIKSDLSNVSLEKPLEKEGRIIYENVGYHYLKKPVINEIQIKSYYNSKITNLSIYSGNEKISLENFSDDELKEVSFEKDETKHFKFSKPVNYDDLSIKYKTSECNDDCKYLIDAVKDRKVVSSVITEIMVNIKGNFKFKGWPIDNYDDYYTLIKNDDLKYVGEVTLYNYEDYKYRSYYLEKEYYSEYLQEPFEDYIYRDEDDYIDIGSDVTDDVVNNTENHTLNTLENSSNLKTDNSNLKTGNSNLETDTLDKSNLEVDTLNNSDNLLAFETNPNTVSNVSSIKTNSSLSRSTKYYILVLLILLLLLIIKLKNKIKEYGKW